MKRLKSFCTIGLCGLFSVGCAASALAQVQTTPNNQSQRQNSNLGTTSGFSTGINQVPWFSNSAIRQQLQLNDDQYNQLNKAHSQAWRRYNQGVTSLDKGLADQERLQRQRGLSESFSNEFGGVLDKAFPDQASRQRYNQMDWQYRGYGAFNDPAIQKKLNLTDEQRKNFGDYQNQWNQQLSTWQREYPNDRDGINNRFRDARSEWQKQIDSTLTPDQRTMWRDLSGKPFDFPIDVYFQGSAQEKSGQSPGTIK